MPNPEVSYPLALKLSDDVTAYIGYKDDRVKIEVATGIPFVGRISLWLNPADLPVVERVVEEHKRWMSLPKPIRWLKGVDK